MSRTYRKYKSYWHGFYGDNISDFALDWKKRWNRDGIGENTSYLKHFSNRLRRQNNKKTINNYHRGVDCDQMQLYDDRNLKYLIWVFD